MAEKKSIYSLGANNGLIIGLYLSGMFALQAFGMKNALLLLLGNLMMLGVPFLLYWLLVRDYDRNETYRQFSAVWLNGIVSFICGSLILATAMYIYLRYIDPCFIATQIKEVIDIYRQLGTPQADDMANAFESIIKQNAVPSPISLAFSTIWFSSFAGSMLSLVIAFIIKKLTRRNKNLKQQ